MRVKLSKILYLIMLFSFCFLGEENANAANYFYLRNVDNCVVKIWKDGKWRETSMNRLVHRPLVINQTSTNPYYVTFIEFDHRYLASNECVFEATNNLPEINNNQDKFQIVNESIIADTPFNYSDDYNRIFLSLDGGYGNLTSPNVAAVDYNATIKSVPSNPIIWTGESKTNYLTKKSWGVGFGVEKFENIFISLRIKNFSGTKTDSVSAFNINSNITIVGDWFLSEAITNYYFGLKQNFPTNTSFVPTIAGFIGLSTGDTILSDGASTYNYRSIGIAALLDAGIEYKINSNFRLGINFEYEYLGKRNLQIKDESGILTNTQTKLNYTNLNALLGLKSYF